MNTLLPLQTRVHHSGHEFGTIVAYNGQVANSYAVEHLGSPEVGAAVQAGLGQAIVNSFYCAALYPYVVKFDSGYEDVYDVDGVVMKVVA